MNNEHPTSNFEHSMLHKPVGGIPFDVRRSAFDVRCFRFSSAESSYDPYPKFA